MATKHGGSSQSFTSSKLCKYEAHFLGSPESFWCYMHESWYGFMAMSVSAGWPYPCCRSATEISGQIQGHVRLRQKPCFGAKPDMQS